MIEVFNQFRFPCPNSYDKWLSLPESLLSSVVERKYKMPACVSSVVHFLAILARFFAGRVRRLAKDCFITVNTVGINLKLILGFLVNECSLVNFHKDLAQNVFKT